MTTPSVSEKQQHRNESGRGFIPTVVVLKGKMKVQTQKEM